MVHSFSSFSKALFGSEFWMFSQNAEHKQEPSRVAENPSRQLKHSKLLFFILERCCPIACITSVISNRTVICWISAPNYTVCVSTQGSPKRQYGTCRAEFKNRYGKEKSLVKPLHRPELAPLGYQRRVPSSFCLTLQFSM